MRVYLDSCCYSRPFDDQRQDRIHLESEAVLAILAHADSGEWEIVVSDVLEFELSRIPDHARRIGCLSMLTKAGVRVPQDAASLAEGKRFVGLGFDILDAAHLAAAVVAKSDVFLTVDDALRKRGRQLFDNIGILVESPAIWLLEQHGGISQ